MSQPGFERNLAFIVGINNYTNGISSLKTAVDDAKTLTETLRTKHNYQIWVCLDEIATLKNLTQFIEQTLPQNVRARDRLLFYFAGHGVALNGDEGPEGYLIPQNASLGNTKTYLPMTKLHDALSKLPCRHFLGILDCCFAGAFRWSSTRDLLAAPEVIHKERYDRFITDAAWQIITSSASDQKALDSFHLDTERGQIGNHSPFATALLEALEGAADVYPPPINNQPSGDGVITATELYLYLRDRVEIPTEQYRHRQTPGIWCLNKHDKGEYIFLSPGHQLNLPPAPPLDETQNPYRGLKSFDEKHSSLFFGRSELTKKLQDFVQKHPLTLVLGASGSGKSSLVKAGLIPQLKQDTGKKWCVLSPVRPGETPFRALNNALVEAQLPAIEQQNPKKTLTESVAVWVKNHPDSKLFIFIDQSEELVTLCPDENERKEFFQQILTAINTHRHQLRVVLSLRSDFEPQVRDAGLKFVCEELNFRNTILKKRWQSGRFVVPAMNRTELREAIEKPAEARVMYFEPHDLVEELIEEVADMPGALPLLSFALSELYLKYLKRQRDAKYRGETLDRALTQDDYEELGGVIQSLTQRADEEYQALVKENPAYEQAIRHVMLRMVAIGGGELARRRVPLSELEYPPEKQELANQVIERFSTARLLVKGQDAKSNPYVEPAHDALVRGWERLQVWLTEEKNLALQRRLTPSAFEWNHHQQVKYLWDANPYLEILNKEVLNSPNNNWLNQVEAEFLRLSLRRQRNKQRRLVAIVTGVILALSGFATFAGYQWRQAERGIIEALTQSSEAQFAVNRNSFDGLIDAVNAGERLQRLPWGKMDREFQADVLKILAQSVNWVGEENRLQGHESAIQSVSFSPNGQMLATASYDNSVKLWRQDGHLFKTLTGHTDAVMSVSFSPDSQMIASGSQDGTVRLWDSEGNLLRVIPAHEGMVMSVSFSPDVEIIATASGDKTVKLWRRDDGQLLETLKGHQALVRQVSFSPSGDRIVTVSDDKTVKLWNYNDKTTLLKTLDKHLGAVTSTDFSSNGQFFVTGSSDGTVKLWNREGQLLNTYKSPREIWSVSISRDETIASSSQDGTISLWTKEGDLLDTWVGHGSPITSVAFSPEGETLVTGGNDGIGKLWQIDKTLTALVGHQERVNWVTFSPDNQWVASASTDGTVKIWSREAKLLSTLEGHNNRGVNTASFNPKGNVIVSGGDDGAIQLWSAEGQVQRTLEGHQSRVMSIGFSDDGQMFASASADGTAKLWSSEGRELITLRGHEGRVLSVAFSPDGRTVATVGDDETVKLWSSGGEALKMLPVGAGTIRYVGFSPDGTKIVTANADDTITLWQRDGTLVATLEGHTAPVTRASVSPDGKMIASVSGDGTIKLWRWDGTLIATLSGHRSAVYAVNFSSDSQWLVSGGEDGAVLLWDVSNISLDGLLERGCAHIHNYLQTQSQRGRICAIRRHPQGRLKVNGADWRRVGIAHSGEDQDFSTVPGGG